MKKGVVFFPLLMIGLLLMAACGPATSEESGLKLAPASDLPQEYRQLPTEVQEAYRFALANPDILAKIPCYCGCGAIGHMDNYMCYVQRETASGRLLLDSHAAG
jgi:hypothetical protein